MNPFKISCLKLLRSTAMTLLFIPAVSAMAPEEDGWENYSHLLTPPTYGDSGASTSSSSTSLDENPVDLDSEGWQIWDPSRMQTSSSGSRAATSFSKSKVNLILSSYLSSRYKVMNAEQYKQIRMPNAPVVHPYMMSEAEERRDFGVPSFPYAARLSGSELVPNLFPALSEAQKTLGNLGIPPEDVDYFYVVQNDPWNAEAQRLLRPQSWAFPDAPYSIDAPYNEEAVIKVAISSPKNSIELTGPSEGAISSHNGISSTNPTGSPVVVSSGPTFPMLAGFKEDQTSFFVSTVVIPAAKRAAVTFHTILSDGDFDLLQTATINTLPELQNWLGKLFHRKYGATSDSSSPYSNWTAESVLAPL